jgi:O-succinylhomoserine sulfhydrylase
MATNKDWTNWRQRTLGVRGGQRRTSFQETSEALFLTSGYAYENPEEAEARINGAPGYSYTRFGNPTISMFEDRLALLEGAPCACATASGMAAVTATLLCCLKAGDHIVAAKVLFGAIRYVIEDLLPRWGIRFTLVDGTKLAEWRSAIQANTKLVFFESPANPTLEILDIKRISEIAHAQGARVVVDNAMASPALQRPMEFGADIVVHSSTKYIDGQGRALGGVILCQDNFLKEHLQVFLRNTGPTISPFSAWLHLKSLETLDLRMREHSHNAEVIAEYLNKETGIARVIYPFQKNHPQHRLAKRQMSAGGGVVTFEVVGGKKECFRFVRALKLIDISNNLGDVKSLITHPATTTHQRLSPKARAEIGVTENMLRLAVGLEDQDDLCEDIAQALRKV